MTFSELVADTRPATSLDLLESWVTVQDQLMELEARLERIEAELLVRGYSIVATY